MPYIETIPPERATGALADIYRRLGEARGKVSNIMQIQSLNPPTIEAHLDLYRAVVFAPSGLSRPEREMVAVAVSLTNGCRYCVEHHAEALRFYWKDNARVDTFVESLEVDGMTTREHAMIKFGRSLTAQPAAHHEASIEELREVGLSDRDILDLTLVVSYFNFVNRMAMGLGVSFDADEVAHYRY